MNDVEGIKIAGIENYFKTITYTTSYGVTNRVDLKGAKSI